MESKYETLQVLGQGSFGMVHQVRHKATKTIYASKTFLRPCWMTEASFLFSHLHPHIVPVYEMLHDQEQRPVLILKYYPSDLHRHMQTHSLATVEALEYLFKITTAVAYLHSNFILHRDLKPNNILVDGKDVCIADFGSCQYKPPSSVHYLEWQTETQTCEYRAPECFDWFKGPSHPSQDIWSLGCILFEMVTGEQLCPANLRLRSKIIKEEYALECQNKLVSYQSLLPSPVFSLMEQMLQIDPLKRLSAKDILRHPVFQPSLLVLPGITRHVVLPPLQLHEQRHADMDWVLETMQKRQMHPVCAFLAARVLDSCRIKREVALQMAATITGSGHWPQEEKQVWTMPLYLPTTYTELQRLSFDSCHSWSCHDIQECAEFFAYCTLYNVAFSSISPKQLAKACLELTYLIASKSALTSSLVKQLFFTIPMTPSRVLESWIPRASVYCNALTFKEENLFFSLKE